MNDQTKIDQDRAERTEKLQGMGCKRKRVEDVRFTQGKGSYVDDLKLPGMLFGDFVRSPHAHARIKSIDTSRAKALPGVVAVLTAADLKPLGLHYMPTLAGDVQAVLAEEKVLFQNQEVAFVIAEDRYIASDATELVDVEYEALPCIVDPFKSMDPDAPILREDIQDKMEGAHGPRKHPNHIFEWQIGDKEATDAVFANADVTIKEMLVDHRTHPSPLETCQSVASFDKVKGELTLWGTFQAPHVIRTVVSLISGLPEHKIHVIAPDIGGGFGNKVGAYAGYVCSVVGSIVLGVPVKWVEDRMENLSTTSFARDYHMTTELAATKDGKIQAMRVHVLADHGAFDACADPSKWPAGFMNICTGSYDIPTAHLAVDGVYTNKASGGVAYRCSFRVTEAVFAIERAVELSWPTSLAWTRPSCASRTSSRQDQFPYQSALGWEYDSGDYHTAMQEGDGHHRLQASCARNKRPSSGSLPARRNPRDHGHRHFVLHRDRRCRPCPRTATFWVSPCSIQRGNPGSPDRLGDMRAWGPKARVRATRRPGPRSSQPKSAFPPTTSWSRKATRTPHPMALAPTDRVRHRWPVRQSPVAARKIKATRPR
jgi:carbon-monoxide dehydrogenase large subunit